MFAYCLNNPIKFSDPTGTLAFSTIAAIAIIATGGIVGGILGAFNAATTDGNILESAIEGCINGLIGSTCGLLITNPGTAIAIAGGTSMIVDAGVQAATQYCSTRDISQIDIDIGRMVKTGVQTGLGTAVPQLGKATGNAVDAFGTALIWAETSTVIVCADIAYTNLTKPKPTSTGYDSGVGGGHQGQSVIKATISCVCLY